MTTPTPDKVAAIVRGLTKPQRRAIVCARELEPWCVLVSGDEYRTAPALCALGLVSRPVVPVNLTPLGLAIRAALTNTGDDDAGR